MMLASELNLQEMLTRERHRIHLIGVAGSGMSGIAALLLELGHDVSGSDKVKSWEVDRLQRLGLRFRAEHRAEDASDADLVIYSSAIRETNPIRAAAAVAGQPLVRRRAFRRGDKRRRPKRNPAGRYRCRGNPLFQKIRMKSDSSAVGKSGRRANRPHNKKRSRWFDREAGRRPLRSRRGPHKNRGALPRCSGRERVLV